MDNVPDVAPTNSPNINSVLKPPKPRVPLKDLITAAPEEDNTAARKRRVSFANVNKIKEFSAGAESMVVCQTPAYEEPFSVSSDSSYPSGIDGWTPAKAQPTLPGKPPIYPEKENLAVQSLRMFTGMDLTSGIRNSDWNSRYSVNGMDLTEAATYATHIDQQTRFSLGMDLTNVAGQPSQNTRYSVSGMELTDMAQTDKSILDQRTTFSIGMDFTNVVGHPSHSTRYSINGMDLTEVANSHQTFFDQRSARLSVGMDMTSVVGTPMPTMMSTNEMDFTETVSPYCYKKQSCEVENPASVSMDDSDALELTEVVSGAQSSAVSPKYKVNNVSLTSNVLYSVNNTRYSVNSMDLTRGNGSCLTSTRRKSSRFSLVNMDLTEALSNSYDLEVTGAIEYPRINVGSARSSLCAMDLTNSIVDKGVLYDMDHTSVVGEQLEYSADTESIVSVTPSCNPPLYDKENVLPNQSIQHNGNIPTDLSCRVHVDLKLNNQSLSTREHEAISEVNPQHVLVSGNNQNDAISILPLSSSHIKNEHLLNESSHSIEIAQDLCKDKSINSLSNGSRNISKYALPPEQEESQPIKNNSECFPLTLKTEMGGEILIEKETSDEMTKTSTKFEAPISHPSDEAKLLPLNSLSCSTTKQKCVDGERNNSSNLGQKHFVKELKLNVNTNNLEQDISRKEYATECQNNFCATSKENSTLLDVNTSYVETSEQVKNIYHAMDISVTDNTGLEKLGTNVDTDLHTSDTNNHESKIDFPRGECSLNESVMNMSIDDCSLIEEVQDVEDANDKIKNNYRFEKTAPVPLTGFETNLQINNSLLPCLQEQNNQPTAENITTQDQSIASSTSQNTSLNMSSSALYNKNITMTRGKSKSFITSPEKTLEISHQSRSITETIETALQNTSEKNFEKRGKRSFEEALKPENDTEESPIKQLCLSREEPSADFEILSNVTAPSFLMETVAPSNETTNHHETSAFCDQFKAKSNNLSEGSKSYVTDSLDTPETKLEFSLRMDDSKIRNLSENPLRHEVIDLCESSFDATSTEVRELISNTSYKKETVCLEDSAAVVENESFDCLKKGNDSRSLKNLSFDPTQPGLSAQPCLSKESFIDNSAKDSSLVSKVNDIEINSKFTKPMSSVYHLKSGSRRKSEKVRSLGNNIFSADLIHNFVEIHFSIDSFDNVNNVSYHSICSGGETDIGKYLMKQARNYVLPEKASDLIYQLQSRNRIYLPRLAKNINAICKYLNGSIKGDVLTLEVASCKNHFWTLIDINIKHPQYLSQADVTISKQKIGELKLSLVRSIFNGIEKTEDHLLNFAKAITELQYNN